MGSFWEAWRQDLFSASPKVKPKTVIRETVTDFVDRLFDGEAMPLVRHLIEDRGLGEGELAQLRSMLDRLEKEADNELKS